MTDSIALRSSFLHEATHLLAVSSPSASASLGAARDRLIRDTEVEVPAKEWDMLRRETCGACGNLMIPGWSCRISNSTQSKRRAKRKANDTGIADTSLVYHCLRCNRKTEQMLQSQARRHMKKKKSLTDPRSETTSAPKKENVVEVPKTANASSKQRQKARKGGLQAMLEKNKTQTSNPGFDLMDFAM